jgi:two-component system nitrate/nitrite sensor histidine kinase NarX
MLQHGEWANAKTEMSDVRRIVHDACYDVRESIDGLRTRLADNAGLIPTAATYLHEFGQRAGLATEYGVSDNELRLLPAVETEVLRIIQEALTNVRKHAQARQVRVNIRADDGMARIEIADDGCGFDVARLNEAQHFGLRIMRERAERLGGSFELTSAPGNGTQVIVRVPLEK